MYVHVQNFLSQTTLYQINLIFSFVELQGIYAKMLAFISLFRFFYNLDGRFLKNRDIDSLVIPLFLLVYLVGRFLLVYLDGRFLLVYLVGRVL